MAPHISLLRYTRYVANVLGRLSRGAGHTVRGHMRAEFREALHAVLRYRHAGQRRVQVAAWRPA